MSFPGKPTCQGCRKKSARAQHITLCPDCTEKLKAPAEVDVLAVPLEVTYDPARKKNFMHMVFEDCTVRLVNRGKEIGSVSGCLGGGVELRMNGNEKIYYLRPTAIWNAFCNLQGKPEWKINKPKRRK